MANEISNALNAATLGLSRAAERVSKDATDLNKALIAAQNQAAAAYSSPAAESANSATVSAETLAATNQNTDILTPLMDLIQARAAYAASVKTTRITADVEQSTVDLLGHRTTQV